MNLIPLKKEQFECLRPLLEERIKDGNMSDHTNTDYILSQLLTTYENRTGGAYVDSVENPTCFLIMNHFPSLLSPDTTAIISGIYIPPSKREGLHAAKTLIQAAEAYARANGASCLLGASWVYRGAEATDHLWTHCGFEPREHTYIKHLN